jgi:hypothetical protein
MFLLSGLSHTNQECTSYPPIKNLTKSAYVSVGFEQDQTTFFQTASMFPRVNPSIGHIDIEEVENELVSFERFLKGNTFSLILSNKLGFENASYSSRQSVLTKRFLYIISLCLPTNWSVRRI